MDLSKSFEFFNPETFRDWVQIVGCGSVGSTVAELAVRFGITKIKLYDFDEVEPHNIVNQMFTSKHIGMRKVDALKEMLIEINPDVSKDIVVYDKGWDGQPLVGYVFLCVDNIELRRKIVEENMYNTYIKGMFDFRTGLTDAQHFAADWTDAKQKKAFLASMKFSHEEAKINQRLSACNVDMCVAPTIRMIANVGVANFINLIKGEHLYKQVIIDAFQLSVEPIG